LKEDAKAIWFLRNPGNIFNFFQCRPILKSYFLPEICFISDGKTPDLTIFFVNIQAGLIVNNQTSTGVFYKKKLPDQ